MNKLFFTLAFIIFTFNCNSQNKTDIKMLTSSFDKKNEKVFLDNFPDNFNDFESTFGWNTKLEKPNVLAKSAYDYVEYFFTLLKKSDNSKYKLKVIKIAINAKWDADGVNYFQNNLINITETDNDFASLLNDLDDNKLTSFWKFYFDKENLNYSDKLNKILTGKVKEKSKIVFQEIKNSRKKEDSIKNQKLKYEIFDADGYTNLRDGQSVKSKIVDKILSGEEVQIIESTNNWWLIKTKKGKTGYVHSDRIKLKK